MNNDFKPTTFRVSDEVRERFKTLAKAEGWNQDEALNQLIGTYEFEQSKIVISERKTEIETFEAHLQALSEVYRMSLQLNQDAEERIKSAYAATLESNQKIILELQGKIEKLENDLVAASDIKDKNEHLGKEIERLNAEMSKTDTICQQYKDKNDTLNGLLTSYKAEHEENIDLKKKLTDMGKLQAEIERLKQQSETDLKMQKLELKEEYQEKLDHFKTQHHEELDKSTLEYKALLKELDEIRKENYSLKEKLLEKPSPAKRTGTKKSTE